VINQDFRCLKCGIVGEALVESGTTLTGCSCGGLAVLVWLKAPGVANKSKGIYPRFSTQLGCLVESAQHENRVAKEKNLYAMGPEEHTRTLKNLSEPEEVYVDPQGFREAAEKAYAEIKSGNVPLERHEATPTDIIESPMVN